MMDGETRVNEDTDYGEKQRKRDIGKIEEERGKEREREREREIGKIEEERGKERERKR